MKKLIITGASGFLGGHIANLAAHHFRTLGLYSTYPFSLKGVVTQRIELSSPSSIIVVLKQFKPAIVIHNAALANPDQCENQPDFAKQNNVIATERIANWCHKNNARLIYVSTDMVFDGQKGNYSETDRPNPLSIYGKSKYEAEKLALAINPDTVVARLALMYGRGIFPRAYNSEWLLRELLQRTKESNLPPLKLYTDQYRSMLAVTNAAQALIELALSHFCGIIHIGGPERISRFAFGEKLCRKLNLPLTFIQAVPYDEHQLTAPRPRDLSLDISLARSFLKTKFLTVDDGLDEMLMDKRD
ncbi:MAG TPA: SDR family oxidoreductase [Candidatus Marinimicrobia bacterium]|nr:SDR family oxidoreductase [Candidatus Neomarinimicrobiota bacterium]